MNKIHFAFLAILLYLPFSLSAQNEKPEKSDQRTISIQGSASREIIPNEYYFRVVIREFMDGKVKKDISLLEQRMLQGLDSIGIKLDQIALDRMSDLQTFDKRKNQEHLTTQLYQIKLSDLEKLQPMLEVLGGVPAQSVTLERVDHCDMVQFRKEVKIEAIKAGKEKADYLLEAVGNHTGKLLSVVEDEVNGSINGFALNENLISNSNYRAFADQSSGNNLTFKTIKIRFSFDLVFEITD